MSFVLAIHATAPRGLHDVGFEIDGCLVIDKPFGGFNAVAGRRPNQRCPAIVNASVLSESSSGAFSLFLGEDADADGFVFNEPSPIERRVPNGR
jgi:hypothetical protein